MQQAQQSRVEVESESDPIRFWRANRLDPTPTNPTRTQWESTYLTTRTRRGEDCWCGEIVGCVSSGDFLVCVDSFSFPFVSFPFPSLALHPRKDCSFDSQQKNYNAHTLEQQNKQKQHYKKKRKRKRTKLIKFKCITYTLTLSVLCSLLCWSRFMGLKCILRE